MLRALWAISFIGCFLLIAAGQAQVPMTGAGTPAPGAASFSGPGDVVSGAKIWWGLRAYSLAKAGTRAANVCNSGDANCADVSTLANGNFDVATAQGAPLNCGGTGGTCTIKVLYDQTVGNNCSGVTCDLTQATAANRPTLVFNCIGSRPCLSFNGTSQELLMANGTSVAQPDTISAVGNHTATGAQNSLVWFSGPQQVGYRNSANNQVFEFAGSVLAATASDGSWHAFQGVMNNASSDMNVDGSSNTGTAGATAISSNGAVGSITGSQFLTGSFVEAGVWGVAFSGGQSSSMSSNQHSYWGF